jgi:hypothetical protein
MLKIREKNELQKHHKDTENSGVLHSSRLLCTPTKDLRTLPVRMHLFIVRLLVAFSVAYSS